MQGTRVKVALLLIVALVAAFGWLDFRAATSQTNVSREVVTSSMDRGLERMRTSGGGVLNIYVHGTYAHDDDPLVQPLESALAEELRGSRFFTRVQVLDTPTEKTDDSLLVVEIKERNGMWTPVYGKAAITVASAFSSNGDVSWRDGKVVAFTSENAAVTVGGKYALADATTGLLSRLSYEHALGRSLGVEVATSLIQELTRATS